jgi:hypothetical protein
LSFSEDEGRLFTAVLTAMPSEREYNCCDGIVRDHVTHLKKSLAQKFPALIVQETAENLGEISKTSVLEGKRQFQL